MSRHCIKCGDQSGDAYFCSDACADADFRDTAYVPEADDSYGESTVFDR